MTDQLTAIREYHSLMPEGALCECGQMEDACDVRFVLHLLDEAAAPYIEALQRTNDCSHSECIDREEDAKADADRLAALLEQVEFVCDTYYCPWCDDPQRNMDDLHADDCPRQEALRQHKASK